MNAERAKSDLVIVTSADGETQGEAYQRLMRATDAPVEWAYEIWDDVVAALTHMDNRARSIAAQLLANMAKSDPDQRLATELPKLVNVTRDEKFVTARHAMQSIWKAGVPHVAIRLSLIDQLERRFDECKAERNCTLIRYDIEETLQKLYVATGDDIVKSRAISWIDREPDAKYQKKYRAVWR